MSQQTIYLAGGCFWGVEAYFARVNGVLSAVSGYANGNTANPSYEDVCYRQTGHTEAVAVIFDSSIISLPLILKHYFRIIDPTTLNRQGNDIGTQYRSGIYFVEPADEPVIKQALEELQQQYTQPIVVECQALENFYPAEEYHQRYLAKNPRGYCHIDLSLLDTPL